MKRCLGEISVPGCEDFRACTAEIIDITHSKDPCNGIVTGSDGALYTPDAGTGIIDRSPVIDAVQINSEAWQQVQAWQTNKCKAGRNYQLIIDGVVQSGDINNPAVGQVVVMGNKPGVQGNLFLTWAGTLQKDGSQNSIHTSNIFRCVQDGPLVFTCFGSIDVATVFYDLWRYQITLIDVGCADSSDIPARHQLPNDHGDPPPPAAPGRRSRLPVLADFTSKKK